MRAIRVGRQPAFTCHPGDSIQAWMQYPPVDDAEDAPLGLVMIVKDEAQSINVTLASARPHIDYWTMVDTGSTDGTQAMVKEAMQGVPGREAIIGVWGIGVENSYRVQTLPSPLLMSSVLDSHCRSSS